MPPRAGVRRACAAGARRRDRRLLGTLEDVIPRTLAGGAILREARSGDEPGILACIHGLAVYEREPDAVENTVDELEAALFGDEPRVFAHVVERNGEIVGIAIWFVTYSTWTGRHGIWLEDLFVFDRHRGRGFGRALISRSQRSASRRDTRAWNGRCWTGTLRPSPSTGPSARCPWRSGRRSASSGTTWKLSRVADPARPAPLPHPEPGSRTTACTGRWSEGQRRSNRLVLIPARCTWTAGLTAIQSILEPPTLGGR